MERLAALASTTITIAKGTAVISHLYRPSHSGHGTTFQRQDRWIEFSVLDALERIAKAFIDATTLGNYKLATELLGR